MADRYSLERAVAESTARLKEQGFGQTAVPYKEKDFIAAATNLRARMCRETGAARAFSSETEASPGSREEELLLASDTGDHKRVGFILASRKYGKVNVNASNQYGKTALHYSSVRNNRKITTALLSAGAKVDAEDILGFTPLHKH